MKIKSLLLGIAFLILIAFAGFFYRNVTEHPGGPVACTMEAKLCPDGTSVGRTGPSCSFAACPPPNVSYPEHGLAFAVPEGFTQADTTDDSVVAIFENLTATSTMRIDVRIYPIMASSTALETIRSTAVGGASGEPVPATSFTSATIGQHRYTVVAIERFEGVVTTAYYLARSKDVVRFDAVQTGVERWTDPQFDTGNLPAILALRQLLSTLQSQ